MLFIYIVDPTSFDDGIFLNVSKEMFHRFYQKVALITIEIMIKRINKVYNAFLHCIIILIYSN